ncbi:hypothetical protein D3C85_999510 [compost metagenome]
MQGGQRCLVVRYCVVIVLATHHLATIEGNGAILVCPGLVEAGLLLGQAALRLLQRRLIGGGIDQEQLLSLGDRLALHIGALEQDAADPGAHIDLAKAGGLADHFGGEGHIGRGDGGHHHGDRGQCLGLVAFVVATTRERTGECQGHKTAFECFFPGA